MPKGTPVKSYRERVSAMSPYARSGVKVLCISSASDTIFLSKFLLRAR